MPDRREICLRTRTRLALLDDHALTGLLRGVEPTRGWGRNRVLAVDGVPIFAKSVPVTDRELAHRYSTRNRYRLPCFYNYGVGSAGFGAFRELAAHVKTTNWVLSGAIDGFPLMYHHRILPRTDRREPADPAQLDRYIRRWNGSPTVRRFIEERRTAKHEIVMFLEWVPHTLYGWLAERPARAPELVASLRRTLAFAQRNGVVHFDAHAHNILTDGEAFYLTDFGLALDAGFDLTARERSFFDRHRHYDHGQFALGLHVPMIEAVKRAPPAERSAFAERYGGTDSAALLERFEDIVADDPFGLGAVYGGLALQHLGVMRHMGRFFGAISKNPRKDTRFDDRALRALLAELPPVGGVAAVPPG